MEMLEVLVQSKLSINFVCVNNHFFQRNHIFFNYTNTLKNILYTVYCIAIPLWFSCKLEIEK